MTDDVNALRPRMMSVAYRMLGVWRMPRTPCRMLSCGFRRRGRVLTGRISRQDHHPPLH